MTAKGIFDQFITKKYNLAKRDDDITFAAVFREHDASKKELIIQSLIDMDDLEFRINLNDVINILPAFLSEKSQEIRPLLNKVVKRVVMSEPRKIGKISPKLLKEFSAPISEALEENVLDCADVIEEIPEESQENFTDAIDKIMQRSDLNDLARIVAMVPNIQLSYYYETIKSLMINSPGICKTMMPLIPQDQVHNFYETLKTIIKDNAYRSPDIIAVIPGDKIHEFREVIMEVMKKNSDKVDIVIEAVDKKNDLPHYIEEIGKVMRQNANFSPAIIDAIAKVGKVEEFERNIWRVMIENPDKLDKIIPAIPSDKLSRFYKTIHDVIKDDKEFNNGKNIIKILKSIPEENRVEFIAQSGKLLESVKNLKDLLPEELNGKRKVEVSEVRLPELNSTLKHTISNNSRKVRH